MPETEIDPRKKARYLYWGGWRVSRIAEVLQIKINTVFAWKYRDKWDDASSIERVDGTLEGRLIQLITKEEKEGKDYKEIDLLGRQLERTARVKKYLAGGNENDLNPKHANKNKVGRTLTVKNNFTPELEEKIRKAFLDSLFDYQRDWLAAGETARIRNILKSRQIGATWYFAREALVDAITTGRNQIFLSASKAQAHVFRQYIIQFAADCGVELRGNPIVLANGATLYFLSTNSRTAQSYHGNLYFDEYFWVQNFAELRKVASGMAMHKRWRLTYFSTPSSTAHQAYPFWSGGLYNKGRKKEDRVDFDLSHAALAGGLILPDGQWRQIVTVEDAVAKGCDLFDIEQLRREYPSPEEYANLLMCHFIDDSSSIFPLALLMRAMVDSWDLWDDFLPFHDRPFGDREVWIGYDPSKSRDSAGLAVVAPPAVAGGKFRLLERRQFAKMDFQGQADAIRAMLDRYRVTYIGIDETGVGAAVHQLVRQFYPAAEAIRYSVEKKTMMVLKGLDVLNKGRLEFDAGWTDVAQSFMAIRKTMTDSGRQMTFKADRSDEVSHADIAWAVLHALSHEPLAMPDAVGLGTARIEIFG